MSSLPATPPRANGNRRFSRAVKPAAYSACNLYDHEGLLTLEIVAQPSRSRATNKWYRVTRLASDFGVAFRLNACCGDKLAAGSESHEVLLAGRDTSCTCPGHAYTGGCKHVEALAALVAEGRLS